LTADTSLAPSGVLGRFQIRHLYPLIALAIYPVVAAGPIGDNSFLWHVRAGAAQWDLGRVLSSDVFSYTRAGEAWRTQSWLAELMYSGLEAATGTVGWAAAFVAVAGLGALALIGIALYGATRSTFTTAIWLFIAVWLAAPFANPRPVILSYLLLAALVLVLRLDDRILWAVVPLMWVWAAVHGSWMIGLGLIVLVAISRRSWKVAAVAGLSAVAVTLTAHGVGTWQIAWEFAQNRDALEFLSEWGRPDFLDIVQAPYLLVAVGVVVAVLRRRIPFNALWVVIPFLLFGLTTERTVFPAAIVLLPYAALAFDVSVPVRASRRPVVAWVVAIAVVAVGVIALLRPVDTFDPARFPSDEVLAALETDRFFHDDAVGGYLIYRDWPAQQVYIDDRAELYGARGFAEFRAAKQGIYEDLFARYGMTEAIVKDDWELGAALARDGWVVSYEDEFFVVMRAPGSD
jgi:hypothetical protein